MPTIRILTMRVPQPKTTHLIPQFCLIEKKLRAAMAVALTIHAKFKDTFCRGDFYEVIS